MAADRPGDPRREREAGIVEARGYIAKVLMGRTHTLARDDGGRLQQIGTRELVLQRRRVVGQAGVGESAALPVPETPPAADEMNSWLLYDDLQGRFHFRHPQELAITLNEPGELHLRYVLPNGKADSIAITPVPRDPDPLLDRATSDPQAFVRNLKDNWSRNALEVVNGPIGWLPDADWAP